MRLYFKSGGFPGIVADSVLHSEIIACASYTKLSKEQIDNPVLKGIFEYIKARRSASKENALETFAAWADFIPIESVVHRDMLNLLYDLADRGLIRFIPQKPSRLSLGSAVMFLDYLADDNGSPSLEELMALPTGNRVNFGDGDLAGDGYVRYIIAMIASRFQDKQ